MLDQSTPIESTATVAMPQIQPGHVAAVTLTLQNTTVTETYRDGNDLIVVSAGGDAVRVEGFFLTDGAQLLICDADTGEVAQIVLTDDGSLSSIEPRSLANLEEMFGTEAAQTLTADAATMDAGEFDATVSTQAVSAGLTPGVIAAIAVGVVAIALIANDDDDGGTTTAAAAPAAPATAVADLLADPTSATVDSLTALGITGATADNLANIQTALGTANIGGVVTNEQGVQALVDAVNALPAGATVLNPTLAGNVLTLPIDTNGGTVADGTAIATIDATTQDLDSVTIDLDADGNIDSTITYTDAGNDGVVEQTTTLTDSDDNGNADTTTVVNFNNTTGAIASSVAVTDADDTSATAATITSTDGTLAGTVFGTAPVVAGDTIVASTFTDVDNDGNAEITVTQTADGGAPAVATETTTSNDTNDDGVVDTFIRQILSGGSTFVTLSDSDTDTSVDTVVFSDVAATFRPTVADAATFDSAITMLDLTGLDGDTTVDSANVQTIALDSAVMAQLATNGSTELRINGDSGAAGTDVRDIVRLDDVGGTNNAGVAGAIPAGSDWIVGASSGGFTTYTHNDVAGFNLFIDDDVQVQFL